MMHFNHQMSPFQRQSEIDSTDSTAEVEAHDKSPELFQIIPPWLGTVQSRTRPAIVGMDGIVVSHCVSPAEFLLFRPRR